MIEYCKEPDFVYKITDIKEDCNNFTNCVLCDVLVKSINSLLNTFDIENLLDYLNELNEIDIIPIIIQYIPNPFIPEHERLGLDKETPWKDILEEL